MQLILCNANLLKLLHFKCGYGPSTSMEVMEVLLELDFKPLTEFISDSPQ